VVRIYLYIKVTRCFKGSQNACSLVNKASDRQVEVRCGRMVRVTGTWPQYVLFFRDWF
jgi:hypothetical protein